MKKIIMAMALAATFGIISCSSGSSKEDAKTLITKTWVGVEQSGEGLEAIRKATPPEKMEEMKKMLDDMIKKSFITLNADSTFEMDNGIMNGAVGKGKWALNGEELKLIIEKIVTADGKEMTYSAEKKNDLVYKLVSISSDKMVLERSEEGAGKVATTYKPKM